MFIHPHTVQQNSLIEDWARIIANLFNAVIVVGFIALFQRWINNPEIGFKRMFRMWQICAAMWGLDHLFWACMIYFGTRHYAEYVTISGACALGVVYYVTILNSKDLEVAMKETEFETITRDEQLDALVQRSSERHRKTIRLVERSKEAIRNNALMHRGA
jgi:hypothetical protein